MAILLSIIILMVMIGLLTLFSVDLSVKAGIIITMGLFALLTIALVISLTEVFIN